MCADDARQALPRPWRRATAHEGIHVSLTALFWCRNDQRGQRNYSRPHVSPPNGGRGIRPLTAQHQHTARRGSYRLRATRGSETSVEAPGAAAPTVSDPRFSGGIYARSGPRDLPCTSRRSAFLTSTRSEMNWGVRPQRACGDLGER